MINKIEINYENTIIILDKINNKYIYNNNNKHFNLELFDALIRLIRTWNNSYINNSILDGYIYKISVYTDDLTQTFVIKNKYPDNFNLFLELIGGSYE